MIDDFVDRGWATVQEPEDHPGRTTTQIAAAVVRGDALADPVEQKLAEDIGDRAHAIVHLDDPDADHGQYEEEAAKNREQADYAGQIATDSLGGIPAKSGGSSRTKSASKAEEPAGSASS
jgi:hypothetical protein